MTDTPDWATLQAVAGQQQRGSFASATGNGTKQPRIGMWTTLFEDRVRVRMTGFMGTGRFESMVVYQAVADLAQYLKELAELTTAQSHTECAPPVLTETNNGNLCWTTTFTLLGELDRNMSFAIALRRGLPSDWRNTLDG